MSVVRRQSVCGSRDGIALLTVLACVLLLTILLISFLSFMRLNRLSTGSYSTSVQADEIAKGGISDILGDLRAEIIAGSKKDPTGTTFTQSGTSIYVPWTNVTAVPARIGYPPASFATNYNSSQLSPSLVRVSRATNNPSAVGGDTFFTSLAASAGPYTNNLAAVPGQMIFDRASLARTDTSSSNGRAISPARWNMSRLLAGTTATIPTAFTTAPPDWVYYTKTGSRVCQASELSALQPTSNVTQVYTTPTAGQNPAVSPVVGRYAFIMYDEGALLDANVAGYSSLAAVAGTSYTDTLTTYNVQTVNGKSYLAYADLTQLPPLSGHQTIVDNFVNWRNASAATTAGAAITGPNYLQAVFTEGLKGFFKFNTNTTTGVSDSPLLSRQDLINYFANLDASGGTTYSTALPYLGTFSRAVSAPSWTPPADATTLGGTGGIYAYKTNAEISNTGSFTAARDNNSPATNPGPNPNRDMANVRYPASIAPGTTILHYQDNATPVSYTVNPGDPLLQNRFSLARIGWLSSTAIGGSDPGGAGGSGANPATGSSPSTTYATAIKACFGLQWGVVGAANGGNACWTYVGSGGGTTATGTIETLDSVANEHREPNFFELLKAAIEAGSLGQSPGQTAWENGKDTPYCFKTFGDYATYPGVEGFYAYSLDGHGSSSPLIPAPARVPDVQIMKIGADIIDQYDADSYPTAIYFNYSPNLATIGGLPSLFDAQQSGSPDGELYGEANMVFGDENLPNLNGIYQIAGTLNSTDTQGMNGWIQPTIYNPHQMPLSFPVVGGSQLYPPLKLQIRAYGQADLSWTYEFGTKASGTTAIPSPGNLDGSYINITGSTWSAFQQLYPAPLPITSTIAASSTLTPLTCTAAGLNSASMIPTNMSMYSKNPFVGFWMGTDLGTTSVYQVYPDETTTITYSGSTPTNTLTTSNRTTVNLESTGDSFVLGWLDNGGGFHPYSRMTNPVGYSYGVVGDEKDSEPRPPAYNNGSAVPNETGDDCHLLIDGRTMRFSTLFDWGSALFNTGTYFANPGSPWKGGRYAATYNWGVPIGYPANTTFVWDTSINTSYFPIDWDVNSKTPSATTTGTVWAEAGWGIPNTPVAGVTYYSDPDGVVRPADGLYANANTGDGLQQFIGYQAYPGYSPVTGWGTPTGGTTYAVGDNGNTEPTGDESHSRRPAILNRPFRSVGELGFAFRDLPFKTLDFFSSSSADAALLDVFSVTDESSVSHSTLSSVVAGEFNPSNAPLPVLQAVLAGGSKKNLDQTYNIVASPTGTEAANIALGIAEQLNPGTSAGPNPLMSRADLVTKLGTIIRSGFSSTADMDNKANLEAPVRALTDVTNTRTWNLMIDIIAQSGRMSPTAKPGDTNALSEFIVEGEKRYWLHIAIDRYTGKIVAQKLEPVYE